MARLPIYTQQTGVGAPEVSMGAAAAPFGALAEVAGGLAEIGAQMKRREDTIDRVQKLGTFDTEAVQMFEGMRSTGDIGVKETTDAFFEGLRARADELISQHRGTSQSRAELTAQLYNQVEQYNRMAIGEQIKAQHETIANNVQMKTAELSTATAFAPAEVINSLAMFDDHLNQIADSMSPQQLTEYRNNGRAQIASSAINGFLRAGDLTNARKLLRDTQIGGMLKPQESRALVFTVAAEEGRRAAAAAAVTNNVRSWQSVLGRDLTPEEASRAAGVDPFARNQSVASQIVELELITGQPATQNDIDRLLNRSQNEPGFGNSLAGRAEDYLINNYEAFAAGMLSPEEGRRFVSSFNNNYGPKEFRDPITGTTRVIQPSAPEWLQSAMETGSRYYGGVTGPTVDGSRVGSTGPTSQSQPAPQVSPDVGQQPMDQQPAPQVSPDAGQQPMDQQAVAPAGQQPSVAERTLWQRIDNLVGVGTAIESKVAGAPFGIGEAVVDPARTQQLRADRQYATVITNNLVAALANNPKYPEGERKMLKEEVDVGPEAFTSRPALRGRMLGINQAVTEREIRAREALTTDISADARRGYMDAIPVIETFRRQLGLPTYLPNDEAWRKHPDMYPPGSQAIDSQGNLFTIPGG